MEEKKRASEYDCELPESEWIERESEKCEMADEKGADADCVKALETEKDKRAEACTEYVDQINKSGS